LISPTNDGYSFFALATLLVSYYHAYIFYGRISRVEPSTRAQATALKGLEKIDYE